MLGLGHSGCLGVRASGRSGLVLVALGAPGSGAAAWCGGLALAYTRRGALVLGWCLGCSGAAPVRLLLGAGCGVLNFVCELWFTFSGCGVCIQCRGARFRSVVLAGALRVGRGCVMANYKIENGTLAARRGSAARCDQRLAAAIAAAAPAPSYVRLLEALTKLDHVLGFAANDAEAAYGLASTAQVLTGLRRVQGKVAVLLGEVRSLAAAVEKGED